MINMLIIVMIIVFCNITSTSGISSNPPITENSLGIKVPNDYTN
jgi:hypothetical protein